MTLTPSKIVCVGRNYVEHTAEMGSDMPAEPIFFLKPPSALIGHGAAIELPEESQQVEHEGEIGVVIGRSLRHASREEVMAGVAGVVCVNDVTARDLQRTDVQWTRAKGFDTFCPAGPRVVPLDQLPALEELEVFCRVNGDVRQHGHARDMAFDIPSILSYISQVMTLQAPHAAEKRCPGPRDYAQQLYKHGIH